MGYRRTPSYPRLAKLNPIWQSSFVPGTMSTSSLWSVKWNFSLEIEVSVCTIALIAVESEMRIKKGHEKQFTDDAMLG